jgi:hypothetical protein
MRKNGSLSGKAEPRDMGMNPHPIDRRRLLVAGGALSGALAGDTLVPQIGRAEDASNLAKHSVMDEGARLANSPCALRRAVEI